MLSYFVVNNVDVNKPSSQMVSDSIHASLAQKEYCQGSSNLAVTLNNQGENVYCMEC